MTRNDRQRFEIFGLDMKVWIVKGGHKVFIPKGFKAYRLTRDMRVWVANTGIRLLIPKGNIIYYHLKHNRFSKKKYQRIYISLQLLTTHSVAIRTKKEN
jgi:hypothetical protein